MSKPRVALFVTCLVDLYRPSLGFAVLDLLEAAGAEVVVPDRQTCCGQPAYNSGDFTTARALARHALRAFADCDYIVLPSGSCAAMLRCHYPRLFPADTPEGEEARRFAERVFELSRLLLEILSWPGSSVRVEARAAYHDACSGLRELGIREEPRRLLATVPGLELVELAGCANCCGFGGTFCVKYPEISTRMVDDKARAVEESGADLLLAGDLGCLLNIAGRLARRGSRIAVRHYAEVLAGRLETPPIGGPA